MNSYFCSTRVNREQYFAIRMYSIKHMSGFRVNFIRPELMYTRILSRAQVVDLLSTYYFIYFIKMTT